VSGIRPVKAVRQSGGGAEAASKGMSTLYTKINEAVTGNYALQQSFAKIGVSLNDLDTMSNKGLLLKTIEGLANAKTQTEKVAIANELLGKSFKGIPIDEVNERLKKLVGTMDAEEANITKAAEANKRLQNATDNLKIAFLDVFGDFFDKIGNLNQSTGEAKKTIIEITAVLGTLIALEVGAKFIEMAKGVRELAIAFGILRASTGWIGALVTAIVALGTVAATYFGISAAIDSYVDKKEKETKATSDNSAKTEENASQKRGLYNEVTKLNAAIDANVKATIRQMEQVSEQIKQETKYIGIGKDRAEQDKAAFTAEQKYNEERIKLLDKVNAAKLSGGKNAEGATVGALTKALGELDAAYKKETADIAENNKKKFDAQALDRDTIFINKELLASNERILDIQDQVAQLTMTNGQKQIAAVDITARKTIAANLETERALLGTNAKISDIPQERVDAITKAVNAQATLEKNALQGSIDKSREFNTGWQSAFNQYVDDATNAATQGKAVFDAMTTAMDGAIEQFVKTGKVNFKDLMTNFVQMIEVMMLKAAAAQVFKASGMGSLFAGMFADGGTIPAGQFGIVGEAGPELVRGPAQVTSAKDTASMGGGGGTHNTYNINAIDSKSVAQLFAENRMTLFGTVEQARRELPMRTR